MSEAHAPKQSTACENLGRAMTDKSGWIDSEFFYSWYKSPRGIWLWLTDPAFRRVLKELHDALAAFEKQSATAWRHRG